MPVIDGVLVQPTCSSPRYIEHQENVRWGKKSSRLIGRKVNRQRMNGGRCFMVETIAGCGSSRLENRMGHGRLRLPRRTCLGY
jgi:hypothetical protein